MGTKMKEAAEIICDPMMSEPLEPWGSLTAPQRCEPEALEPLVSSTSPLQSPETVGTVAVGDWWTHMWSLTSPCPLPLLLALSLPRLPNNQDS